FLREIAFMLADLPCEVIVEGHTDDLPIHTDKFPSNWELSAVRAVNVVKVLMEYGIPPSRLAAVGYGEFRPLKPNDSERHRAMNRRAEILIRWLEEGYE
ncbi:MAG TPA: chemotaxis protein MotB, partial [Firmicutes bacterium]|nr:chemotaxis protein MotB [Bacillota bacterium]